MINLYTLHSDPEQLLWYDQQEYLPANAYETLKSKQLTKLERKKLVRSVMMDPWWAYHYIMLVRKRRWPAAEPYLMKDPELWASYKKQYNIK